VRTSARVLAITRSDAGWRVLTAGRTEDFDSVILALPALAAAALLNPTEAHLASLLGTIPYSSSLTVNLGYDRASLAADPGELEGFGFLVPRGEGRQLLACTYTHNKFPHRVAA